MKMSNNCVGKISFQNLCILESIASKLWTGSNDVAVEEYLLHLLPPSSSCNTQMRYQWRLQDRTGTKRHQARRNAKMKRKLLFTSRHDGAILSIPLLTLPPTWLNGFLTQGISWPLIVPFQNLQKATVCEGEDPTSEGDLFLRQLYNPTLQDSESWFYTLKI